MNFKKLNNGIPTGNLITYEDLSRIIPDIGADTAPEGYVYYQHTDKPENLSMSQEYVEISPTEDSEGTWTTQWELQDIVFANKSDETKHIAETTEVAASVMRVNRNYLLSKTDFYAMPDSPAMSTEMATYRQALRDLPSNIVDVFDVTYPTNPE
jgi:hypothetical protein